MSLRRKKLLSYVIILTIGFGLGWVIKRPAPIPEPTITKQKGLKKELVEIRKTKAEKVKESMVKQKVNIKTINKKLEEFERRYEKEDSGLDSSIIFSSVRDSFITDSVGLGIINGLITENEIQKVEIAKLDSIVTLDSLIIINKNKDYKKKKRKGILFGTLSGILVGMIIKSLL